MPRSPSPPYRSRGGGYPRRGGDSYRYQDRPRDTRFERDRDYDYDNRDRQRPSYGRGPYRDDRRRDWSRSRSRSRSRDRMRDRDDRGGSDRHYVPDDRSRSPVKPPRSIRSLTPEEGQITSPPPRQRSPVRRSPPPRRRDSPPPPPSINRNRDRSTDRIRDWRDDRRPIPRDIRYSPSPRMSTRDLSPGSSRSRSSRFASPERYRHNPPSSRARSPVRHGSVDRERERQPERRPNPVPVELHGRRPVPVPVPFGSTRANFRQPPSGPRSERMPPTGPSIPSGPRALQTQMHSQSYPQPQSQPAPPPTPAVSQPPVPSVPPPTVNPYTTRVTSTENGGESSPSAHRLSWAERKGDQSPSTIPEEPVRPMIGEEPVAPPPPPPQPQPPRISEAELTEIRRQEENARIDAELPELKVSFASAPWEIELEQHFKHMKTLEANTIRAQSAQRIAKAMWSDAEADRVAATERRRIAEEQLARASSLGGGVSLL